MRVLDTGISPRVGDDGRRPRASTRRGLAPLGVALAAVCGLLVLASAALAVAPAPEWSIHSLAAPSSFTAGENACEHLAAVEFGCAGYLVTVRDAGSGASDGSPVVLRDVLPAGVVVQQVQFFWSGLPAEAGGQFTDLAGFGLCGTTPPVVSCQLPTAEFGLPPVAPDDTLTMRVYVTVEPGVTGPLANTASVSGGGAPEVLTDTVNPVGVATPFGASLAVGLPGLDGVVDTQAGGHPDELLTRIDLNTVFRPSPEADQREAIGVRDVRDVVFDLPVGFVGSALATPRCTFAQLSSHVEGGVGGCPADTVVGHILSEPNTSGTSVDGPLYNMVPEHGVAAELAYVDTANGTHALYVSVAPTPAGYVLRTTSPELPQVHLRDIEVVLYGNPAVKQEELSRREGKTASGIAPVAFFTNPSACTGEPLVSVVHLDSWFSPGGHNADGAPDLSDPNWAGGASESPPVTGCNLLRFTPSLSVQPETGVADSPTGVEAELKVPQREEPETLATPPLRDATVTLPAGLTVNPAAAGGLGACGEAQIGWGGASLTDFTAAPPTCPESSKIGSVEAETPALPGVLQGSIYLAAQNENPFHSLLAGYIVIDDPTTGVVVKVPGDLTPDPGTGRITAVFKDSPQFPISDLKLRFFGGPRAPLATPEACGTYTTASDLMPWSAPDSGPDAMSSSSFPVSTGCVTGFAPGFTAGSVNPQAAGYSPFTLSLSRTDSEQNLAGVSVSLPPGLLGKIAGIPLCPEANASNGTCPEASRVGSVQAAAGVGPAPYFVGGNTYLTGPYNGGPYGLVVEIPAIAGPFNLGTVVVRASIRIDPRSAQVTTVSDPLPTILQGIPLRVRRVDVTLDRPGFTFNPTSCTPMAVTGIVTSTEGASSNVSSRFQAGGCRELPFKPSFKVTTQARTSKKQGASLDVKVGSGGGQANIGKVAVSLPKQLPSRLTTIQQACTKAVFDANPASCPAGSNIGIATANTPVLAGPLTGPAYLVSHGGAAFPDLVIILQGGGVTLDLVGSIDIRKGVTSSAFDSVPDAPIFELRAVAPRGPALRASRGPARQGQGQPLRRQPGHADHDRRAERRRRQAEHQDRRQRLPKAEAQAQAAPEGQGEAKRPRQGEGGKEDDRLARRASPASPRMPSTMTARPTVSAAESAAARGAGRVAAGEGRSRVSEIQRARILTAVTEVARERGAASVTVAHIVARSGVSRRTFYELFEDREDCFLAALEQAIDRAGERVLPAYRAQGPWRERIRAGLEELLGFLDEEPAMGALCVVDSLSAGPVAGERRGEILGALVDAVHEGRREARGASKPTRLVAEGAVGAVLSMIHTRLQGPSPPRLRGLLNPLMSIIVLPYLGARAAERELRRPIPRARAIPRSHSDPLRDLDMRLTYRTVRVLIAVASQPGASNRQVATAAGISDQGQISKLLRRLETLGLLANSGGDHARGEANAWVLAAKGEEVERAIRAQTEAG